MLPSVLGADEPRLSRNVLERRRRRLRATALSARATVNPWVTPSSEPSAQAPGLRESPRQDETPSGKPGRFRRVEAKLLTLRQTYRPPPSCLGSACTLGGAGGDSHASLSITGRGGGQCSPALLLLLPE